MIIIIPDCFFAEQKIVKIKEGGPFLWNKMIWLVKNRIYPYF